MYFCRRNRGERIKFERDDNEGKSNIVFLAAFAAYAFIVFDDAGGGALRKILPGQQCDIFPAVCIFAGGAGEPRSGMDNRRLYYCDEFHTGVLSGAHFAEKIRACATVPIGYWVCVWLAH